MAKFPVRLLRSRLEKPRSREPSQPTPSYEHIKNFTKDIEVRRDLGNRASPVNCTDRERPTLSFSTSKDYYVDVLCIDPATEKLTFYWTKSSESTENSQTSIR